MKFVKIIDNRKCIGCHACSVACKEENQVPLGVFRTWVKYVEKGAFPHTRRHFQVTRCNQCENPPCVRICPTSAMYRRPDGIVEFDGAQCIACKACLQACPYDAIYIDPESQTAAKCHFCAHRIDRGLEPACVVVCPERAIIIGDVNDPQSEVARLLASEETSVRKPEQGTRPNLFYIDGERSAIDPLVAARASSYLWSDLGKSAYASSGWLGGPIQRGDSYAAALARNVYDVPHEMPWGWKVSTYLWTKSISAGTLFIPTLGITLGAQIPNPFAALAGIISLVFLGITTFFLIWDLKQPLRFWKIIVRPQKRSWLALGAFILLGFAGLGGAWLVATVGLVPGWGALVPLSRDLLQILQTLLNIPVALLAILAAVYSAFLFAQAEGRDLWQSRILPLVLSLHALAAGAAALLIAVGLSGLAAPSVPLTYLLAGASLGLLASELGSHLTDSPATENARAGRYALTHGRIGRLFWGGVATVAVGLLIALASAESGSLAWGAIVSAVTLAGLLAMEHAWVQAGQVVPNS